MKIQKLSSDLATLVGAYRSLKALGRAVDVGRVSQGALRAMGLQRRGSTLGRVLRGAGMVAVGAAVGAGVALLLAPDSGARTRQAIRDRVRGVKPVTEPVSTEPVGRDSGGLRGGVNLSSGAPA